MRRMIAPGLVSLGIFVVWFACSSGDSDPCNVVSVLENKDVEARLTAAFSKREPTEIELKAAALYWGLTVLAAGEGEIDSFLIEVPISELLQDIPTSYPELVTKPAQCVRTGTDTQALIASKADFSCSQSCVPSPDLLAKTGKTIQDKLVGDVVTRLKQAGKYTRVTQWMRDKLAQIKNAQRVLAEQYKVANKVYTWSQKINDLLDILNKTISLQDAEELTKEVLDVMEDVAKFVGAKKLAMALVAYQMGWEIGKMATLVYECEEYKTKQCTVSNEWSGKWSGTYSFSFLDPYFKEIVTNSGTLTASFEFYLPGQTGGAVDAKVLLEFANWRDFKIAPVRVFKVEDAFKAPTPTEKTFELSMSTGHALAKIVLTLNGTEMSGVMSCTSSGCPDTKGAVFLKKQ